MLLFCCHFCQKSTVTLHFHFLVTQIVDETLPALLELKQQGIIRAIGITGYPLDIFSYILDKWVAATVPQLEVLLLLLLQQCCCCCCCFC
jgi:diketogulonate reductase-like aldo/keto reductase